MIFNILEKLYYYLLLSYLVLKQYLIFTWACVMFLLLPIYRKNTVVQKACIHLSKLSCQVSLVILCKLQLYNYSYTLLLPVIESEILKIGDLRTVQNKTWNARWKWYHTGIGLDIGVDTLEAINLNHQGNCERCYTLMLTEWLRRANPRPTWSALAEALRSPSVNMRNLAAQIVS